MDENIGHLSCNALEVPEGTFPLAFAGRYLLASERGSGRLLAFDARRQWEAPRVLYEGATFVSSAVARDLGRVILMDQEGPVVVEAGRAERLAYPAMDLVKHVAEQDLSPSGRFLTLGGFVGQFAERAYRVVFVDLTTSQTWQPDGIRGPWRWIGERAVVGRDLLADPATREIIEAPDLEERPSTSPSGLRSFEIREGDLVVESADGASLRIPGDTVTARGALDTSDYLRWLDDRWLFQSWSPGVLIDAETGETRTVDPRSQLGDGQFLVSSDRRRVALRPEMAYSPAFLADLMILPSGEWPIDLEALPARLLRGAEAARPEAETLALELADALLPWGFEVGRKISWRQGDVWEAETASDWCRPIGEALQAAHRGRDGHHGVCLRIGAELGPIERCEPLGFMIGEIIGHDADWRSAAALDLEFLDEPWTGKTPGELGNPFPAALRIIELGFLVLDVGADGITLFAAA